MKANKVVLLALLIPTFLVGCANANKNLIYGTWINEKMNPAKTVETSEGWHDYSSISDTTPYAKGPELIVRCWTDADGAVWYQTHSEERGAKFQTLQKISKSGTVREMAANPVDGWDPKYFPKTVDPSAANYHIWYRAK